MSLTSTLTKKIPKLLFSTSPDSSSSSSENDFHASPADSELILPIWSQHRSSQQSALTTISRLNGAPHLTPIRTESLTQEQSTANGKSVLTRPRPPHRVSRSVEGSDITGFWSHRLSSGTPRRAAAIASERRKQRIAGASTSVSLVSGAGEAKEEPRKTPARSLSLPEDMALNVTGASLVRRTHYRGRQMAVVASRRNNASRTKRDDEQVTLKTNKVKVEIPELSTPLPADPPETPPPLPIKDVVSNRWQSDRSTRHSGSQRGNSLESPRRVRNNTLDAQPKSSLHVSPSCPSLGPSTVNSPLTSSSPSPQTPSPLKIRKNVSVHRLKHARNLSEMTLPPFSNLVTSSPSPSSLPMPPLMYVNQALLHPTDLEYLGIPEEYLYGVRRAARHRSSLPALSSNHANQQDIHQDGNRKPGESRAVELDEETDEEKKRRRKTGLECVFLAVGSNDADGPELREKKEVLEVLQQLRKLKAT